MSRIWRRVLASSAVVLVLAVAAGIFAYWRPLWVLDQQGRFQLWRSGVQSKFVDVDGYRIHYLDAPAGTGTAGVPLVLIHGLGARGQDWAPLIPGLAAAGFHVYVPDLLGYGRSAHPDISYSISTQEKLVADFMTAVHIDSSDVAGWSMGGWVAMKLAADHAEMVNRLVLFDAAGTYFPGYSDIQGVFDAKDVAGVNRLFALLSPHPKPIPEFIARDLARRIQGNVWVIKRSMAAMTSGRDLMDFRLYTIMQPTLVVWGKQDALIPLSSGETIHRGIHGSSLLIVDGCGHLTPAECSGVSLRGMVTFLQAEPPLSGVVTTVDGGQ